MLSSAFKVLMYTQVIRFLLDHNSVLEAKVLQSFSKIAERSIPSVVNIRTKTYIRKDPDQDLYQFFLMEEFLKEQVLRRWVQG